MHKVQRKLLKAIKKHEEFDSLSWRKKGKLVGVEHPQTVKHHMEQLLKKGFIQRGEDGGYKLVSETQSNNSDQPILSIPILGSANCGDARLFADDKTEPEGYLKLSKKLVNKTNHKLYALRAEGDSLDKANIDGASIDHGDYIIVDSDVNTPNNGDYVVSIIDGVANVKKFQLDKENNQIKLTSESSNRIPPFIIHPDDKYLIAGKVVRVIKKEV